MEIELEGGRARTQKVAIVFYPPVNSTGEEVYAPRSRGVHALQGRLDVFVPQGH